MKNIYIFITITILGFSATFSQNLQFSIPLKSGEPSTATSILPSNGFSPQSAFLLIELDQLKKNNRSIQKTDSLIIDKYNLFFIGSELFVNAFLIVTDEFDLTDFESRGFFINSKSNNIVTASIPVHQLNEVIEVKGISYVQIAEKADLQMDVARASTWVYRVHQGMQLPQSYHGNGVVIGIIDNGFDYTHPNFFDSTGINKIKRVWEQNATTGTPPNGLNYGRELKTQSTITSAQRDMTNVSHGTHVAGIAAGSGVGTLTDFAGVAPQSDLVLVSTKSTDIDIANGIAYIINYANSVNKPCVINVSFGHHKGPHDGTSLFDQYCDGILGPGKLLVGAAGNDGLDPLYLSKTYTLTDTLILTCLKFNNGTSPNYNNGAGTIDIWGVPNQNFWVAVNIWNANTSQFEDYTPYISANSNKIYNYTLYDKDPFKRDPLIVQIGAEINSLNNKPRISVIVNNSQQDDAYRWVLLEIIGYNTQTKMWGGPDNVKTIFTQLDYSYPVVGGSTNSTVREIGGTGKSIISVGAYTSKNSWEALNNSNQTADYYTENGAITPFSSKGPTADNRTKPDITAPGNVIVSSVSRFDNNYKINSNSVVQSITNGTDNWLFATMAGTSMSCPIVTGILALWLQAYPHLTPIQAKQLLKDNAWTDSYTGTIPSNGNNTWGWGKIDAHKGLLDLVTKIPPQPTINPTNNITFCQGLNAQLSAPDGFSYYQWSNNETTQNITVSTAGNYSVRVGNNNGFISPWSTPKLVTVYPKPPTPTISNNDNVLTSSSSTRNQWYRNNEIIQGATQQTYKVQNNGVYFVMTSNSNNCTTQSLSVIIRDVSIVELEKGEVISVYPNPTNEKLNILFSDYLDNVQLELYDVSGKLHIQNKINSIEKNSIETLNLNQLTNGIYTLKISTSVNQSIFKIVVSK